MGGLDSARELDLIRHPFSPRLPAARRPLALLALLASTVLLASCSGYGKPSNPGTELAFGVDMARRGLWNEAIFRFQEAERADPQNPRVQNNLGVAFEAQGDFDRALEHYKRALQIAPGNKEMRANYARFVEFYQSFKSPDKGKAAKAFGKGLPGAAGKPSAGDSPGSPASPGAAPLPVPSPPPSTQPRTPPGSPEPSNPGQPTGPPPPRPW